MILYFNGINSPYVCSFDIEHESGRVIQFAGIMFKRVGPSLYQLCRNINIYAKTEISKFISNFTNISQEFLDTYGLSEDDFVKEFDAFMEGVEKDDVIFVSHGATQDLRILFNNGVPVNGARYMCTYALSKKVLDRPNHLTLSDVAEESGFIIPAAHNAYEDALTTAFIFSFLLKEKGGLTNDNIFEH